MDICPNVTRHRTAWGYNALHLVSQLELAQRIYYMNFVLIDSVSTIIKDTPAHTLSSKPMRNVETVMFLLNRNPNLLTKRTCYRQETPLSSAYRHSRHALVEAILTWQPDWKETTTEGHTVLHMIAVCASNSDIVARVLQYHDRTTRCSYPTPYSLAVRHDNLHSQQVLEQYETCDTIIQTHVAVKKNCWPKMQPIVDCLHQFLLPELTTIVFAYLGLEPCK